MKSKALVTTLFAAAALALGAAAQAQAPATTQAGQHADAAHGKHGDNHDKRGKHKGGEHRDGKGSEKHAERLAAFKQKLNLTAAQQPAWDQYVAAMQPPAHPAGAPDSKPKLDKQQREQAMQQHKAARDAADKAFYAQLNPAQQNVFNEAKAKHGERHTKDREHGKPASK